MRQGKWGLALACALALYGSSAAGAAAAGVQVLSNRADLISGGDALVAVDPPNARVSLNGHDVTGEFAVRPNGRYEGLVTGLALGSNTLSAAGARATIVNHPIGGPVLAGPQVQPWVCQNGSADPQCDAPTTYSYEYKSSLTGQLESYDPSSPPSDVATTTTDQSVTVPFIVHIETGYQDRDQYQIATLFQPGKPWQPWAPQPQWNHKLLITHGASCGIDHQSGTAPSVTGDTAGAGGSPTTALGLGFAVMSTALDNAGHNCSLLTEAESLIMAKEHLVESYGEIRYTIGTGCSGGSLVQQQVANAYPGIYQGILPNVAIIDLRGTDQGEFHDVYRAFAIRARLEQQNGTFANQVIWEGVVPLLGDVNYTTQGLLAMDRWLSAVEKDRSTKALSQKIIADRPADVHDQCTDGLGQVIPSQSVCQLINPVFSTPRIVAGESIATDVEKCQLKPLRRSDFLPAVQFTDDEWAELQKAFPTGVCDWGKRGVDQRPTIPWRTYQDASGKVIYGGASLGAAPAGSGGGWAGPAFSSWLNPATG